MNNAESNTPETELDGFAQIEELLGSEDDTQAPESEETPADPEAESEDEAPEESDDETDDSTEEEEDDEQPEEAKLEEIEIDGKTFKVSPEVKAGYLRQQDYTRKTQEVAELKKSASAEIEEARRHRAEYQQGMKVLETVLRQSIPKPPDQSLLEDDPIEFMRQERRFNAQMQQFQAMQAQQQRLAEQERQEQERHYRDALEEARKELPSLIPAWKDAKTAEKERPEIAKYLLSEGYSQDEVSSASDPRAIKLARKAWLYDQLIAQKKQAKPVATKVAQPGASRKPSSDVDRKKQFSRLKQTGRLEDAVGILENLI